MSKTKRPANPPRSNSKPNPGSAREPLRGNSAFEKAFHEMRHQPPGAYPNVSGRWLLKAAALTLVAIAVLAWSAYCWLFWQGSWQLLYHPTEAVKRTPSTLGLNFEPVRFGTDASGTPLRTGWWIPAEGAHWTILYLHGADGNLGDTVDAVSALHRAGAAVFAIDYRGYGQSAKIRPSEARWLEDAGAAISYLTETRHLSPAGIVVYGQGLGANLAAELATNHASLAGVILDRPSANGAEAIFADPRSRLVPARWLVRDRWDLTAASTHFGTPSLWLLPQPTAGTERSRSITTDAYSHATQTKSATWLGSPSYADPHYLEQLNRWMDDLTAR